MAHYYQKKRNNGPGRYNHHLVQPLWRKLKMNEGAQHMHAQLGARKTDFPFLLKSKQQYDIESDKYHLA